LLTGIISNNKLAKKAVKLAWEVKGVKEVIDEIQIASNKSRFNGFRTYSKDAIISSQIETRGIFTKNISLRNVKVNTVNSVVYLIGVAKTDYEIRKVTNLIARIKGVKKVISHIIKTNDSRRRT
jgi:osmotically-inducible protein OsmY